MEGGVATVCFATGMAAIGAIMLALLKRGRPRRREPVPVRQHDQPVRRRWRRTASTVTFVDATDVAAVEAALTPATRLVFVETIANPRTQVADLARIGELCARARHRLRRRQHDDLAVAVPPEGRSARAWSSTR